MEKATGVQIQSLARAFDILRLFVTEHELGISEISDKMGLSKSTVYGLVNTLASAGYLEQSPGSRKYRLGLTLFELGNLVQRRIDVRELAAPFCRTLSESYHTTVHLAVYAQGEIVYIDKIGDADLMISFSQVGKRAPMHCTGVGKAILAFLPEDRMKAHVDSMELVSFTPHTITRRDRLLLELEQIRASGFAQDNEEIELGLNCVAAPIFNHESFPVAGISLSFPWGKIREVDKRALICDVRESAAGISARMGCGEKRRGAAQSAV